MKVKIFVEGVADVKFLSDYISYKYGIILDKNDIVETKGWTNIYSQNQGEMVINQMLMNSSTDGVNLLIFDADNNFEERLEEIISWKLAKGLIFETFLLPNNANPGDLETNLERIINSNNSVIFDCWENYERCLLLKTISGRTVPLTVPAKKTKIYGYLEALLGESKSQKEMIKERSRDYMNRAFWNLDSDQLEPLRYFLDKYFL